MKKLLLALFIPVFVVGAYFSYDYLQTKLVSGAPPYEVADDPPSGEDELYAWLKNWKRPEGPTKVALQVGHWKSSEAPDELHRLRGNTGATGDGKAEWEVNMAIAEETAKLLESEGIGVEILPTTIPPGYFADVFVSIHADGSLDPEKSGYKAAAPRRDMTGNAEALLKAVEKEYAEATKLTKDPNVTRNMRGYYAFGWWRYKHAVHPMTTSIILETGFLTSPADRELIVDNPEISAQGLAKGILEYLLDKGLIEESQT